MTESSYNPYQPPPIPPSWSLKGKWVTRTLPDGSIEKKWIEWRELKRGKDA